MGETGHGAQGQWGLNPGGSWGFPGLHGLLAESVRGGMRQGSMDEFPVAAGPHARVGHW